MKKYFYDVDDIKALTGFEKSKSYALINEANKLLKEKCKNENKEVIILKGRIPIWFFEEIIASRRI